MISPDNELRIAETIRDAYLTGELEKLFPLMSDDYAHMSFYVLDVLRGTENLHNYYTHKGAAIRRGKGMKSGHIVRIASSPDRVRPHGVFKNGVRQKEDPLCFNRHDNGKLAVMLESESDGKNTWSLAIPSINEQGQLCQLLITNPDLYQVEEYEKNSDKKISKKLFYHLYLYKSDASSSRSDTACMINDALMHNSGTTPWSHSEAVKRMRHFDVEAVKKQIEDLVGDKCTVTVCFPPKFYDQIEYLVVETPYESLHEVMPFVHAVVLDKGLFMFDEQTYKTYHEDLVDSTFVTLKIREDELKNAIMHDMQPLQSICKIQFYQISGDPDHLIKPETHLHADISFQSEYIVTLNEDPDKSFEERTAAFMNCLKSNLKGSETMLCHDRSFVVHGNRHAVTYSLEGYGLHADRIGYYAGKNHDNHSENEDKFEEADQSNSNCDRARSPELQPDPKWGLPQVRPIRRMPAEEAFEWIENNPSFDAVERLNKKEMLSRYHNPGERLAKSVEIQEWFFQQPFRVRVTGISRYGKELVFHVVPLPDRSDEDQISMLSIACAQASFVLPFIDNVYPSFRERSWTAENHIPLQMWKQIILQMKEVKELILNDIHSPKLTPYIEWIDLHELFAFQECDEEAVDKAIKEDPIAFLYEHRLEIVALFDVFIQWGELQLQYYPQDRMMNIQGPKKR